MIPEAHLEINPSGRRNQWMGYAILFLGALVTAIVLWFSDASSTLSPYSNTKDSPYNLLVDGFRTGHLYLDREVPPELAKLSNPYNPAFDARSLADLSYYKGKFYLYFGVTPALVLFWPYAILTCHYLSDKAAVIIFFTSGFLIAAVLLHDLWRRYLSNVNPVMAATAMFTMVLALALTIWCNYTVAAISCGFAFMMLALWATWRALHGPKARVWWMLLASLSYGLAVGARPSLLFGGIILLLPVVQAWRWDSWKQAATLLGAAAGPAMLIGSGLMLYNNLRFDNPFEFGWHYQLNQGHDPTVTRQFSLNFLWFNFHLYFLQLPGLSSHFAFLKTVPLSTLPSGYFTGERDAAGGVLVNYPFVMLMLAAPLVWRGRPEAEAWLLRSFVVAVFLQFAVLALTLCLFFAAGARYEMDFLPALVMLAVVGILGLERALASLPLWRCVMRWGVGLLVVYSLVYNLFANVETHATSDYLVGNAMLSQGRLDEATMQYQKALSLWSDCADANAGLGSVLFQKGQIDQAIVQYQKALEIKPASAETHNNLGYCFLQKGQLDQAIVQFQSAVRFRPDSAAFHNILANALYQKGEIRDAMIEYKTALDLNPDFAQANYNLGCCLLQEGRLDDAIAQYEEAIKIQPQSETFRYALAGAWFQKGRIDEAMVQYQTALEIKPDFAEARYNLGYCLFQEGRTDDAIIQFKKAVEVQPNFPEAYNSLGDAFRLKGNGTKAVDAYQKAMQQQPQFILPQMHLAWMLATWPDAPIRDGSKAVTLAEKANELSHGADPQILRTLAAAYAETGRYPEAISTAQKALALATAQPNTALANELQKEIGLYRNHSACRSNN
jgi:tetratricopeptide (TPR) repeat protein